MKAAACQSPSCIKKIKYSKKRFSICRTEFLHPAMWHDHDIDFTRWLHSAMWHVAPESWHWIRQVAAPCNVAGGSAMNEPLNSPKCLPYWNSTSGFDFYTSPQSTRQGVGGCPTMPTPPLATCSCMYKQIFHDYEHSTRGSEIEQLESWKMPGAFQVPHSVKWLDLTRRSSLHRSLTMISR